MSELTAAIHVHPLLWQREVMSCSLGPVLASMKPYVSTEGDGLSPKAKIPNQLGTICPLETPLGFAEEA